MKSIIIAITAALVVVAGVSYFNNASATETLTVPTPVFDAWVHWKKSEGKAYGNNSEEKYRMNVFADNYKVVAKLNEEQTTATFALNKFADLETAEFARLYTGFNQSGNLRVRQPVVLSEENLSASVNWVTAGAVAAVKDQGQCGSCWAFSAVCAIESANYLQKKMSSVPTYSEQQLVDCGGATGNQGCNGGLMDNAFRYVETNKLQTEDDYPYRARDGTCKHGTGVGSVSGLTDVTSGSPSQLKAALMMQPVSVAVEADQSPFQFYNGGVVTSSACGQQLDHGVAAVGYGMDSASGEEYFLVRNSWGASWGLSGYLKISTSSDNICGILSQPSYPKA